MFLYRYSRWDGSQEFIPINGDELMEDFSEKLVASGDVATAIKSLTQRGLQSQNVAGVQELVQRIQKYRDEILNRYDVSLPLVDLKQRLDHVINIEKQGITQHLREMDQRYQQKHNRSNLPEGALEQLGDAHRHMSAQNLSLIRQLPDNTAHAIQRLNSYEFTDDLARTKFHELLASLQETVLGAYRKDLFHHIQHLGLQDMVGLKEMLRDLNNLLTEKLQGQQPSFQNFLNKHRQILASELPNSFDELLEQIQAQITQMDSLLRSMNFEQRQELREVLKSAFDDEELQAELAQLTFGLEQLNPLHSLSREYKFHGDDPLRLDEALDLMDLLQDMEQLEKQLKRTQRSGRLSEVRLPFIQSVFGPEVVHEFQQLVNLADALESGGYIRQIGSRYELTPRGIRKIGQRSLREIFSRLKQSKIGDHYTHFGGGTSGAYDGTKKYEYGDKFDLHLSRTMMNAIQRRDSGVPLKIQASDFEIYHNEQLARSSTVLLVDLSLSMAARGNFLAAKKVTLALDSLIRNQFPRDRLHVVGFSTYAREFELRELPYLNWDEAAPYTNIQHGLIVAQRLLSRAPGGTNQIILISDGEPTAYIGEKQLFVQYPPTPKTIHETLIEVKKCTARSIRINTFMLDQNPQLVDFVKQISRINRGRTFYTNPELLGQYILIDYLKSKKEVIS